MPGTISQYQVVIAGQLITASLWNGMELNIINNGLIPAGIDDYSANDTEMQTMTDPYPAGATSRPTSLQGEMERLRFQFDNIIGKTYWYEDPDVDIATFKTRFDAHTHDGTANNGPQLTSSGLAANSVITSKIADGNITGAKIGTDEISTAKIAALAVTTAKIAANAVDETKIASSVAGNGLAGGAGTALSVNVDASTIEINADTLRVKDGGITAAKLSAAVLALMSPKTINIYTKDVTLNSATVGMQVTSGQTITSVDTSKAYVVLSGFYHLSGTINGLLDIQTTAKLTSATNVDVTANLDATSTSGNAVVRVIFTVVEWN